jgi:hypothetical protein
VLIQSAIQCAFAVIIYKFIVQKRGSPGAYLLGWGFILPIAIYIPFFLLEYFDMRNRVLNLSASTVMTVIFFRCLEAMYNTSPDFVELSLQNYVAYYSSIAPFAYDPKTKARKRVTGAELLSAFVENALTFTAASLVLSFVMHHNFRIFDSPVEYNKLEWSLRLLSPAHIGNAYFHAILLYCTLKIGFELNCFGENAKGVSTKKVFDSPFLKSTSPTDFWTKRWNIMIQPVMRGGVFLPAKIFFPKKVALLITFVVSGLYHDYVWFCVFYSPKHLYDEKGVCEDCYEHKFGRVTLFFLFVGIIVLLERPLGKLPQIQWMAKHLPSPAIAHFLLLVHLPLAHW